VIVGWSSILLPNHTVYIKVLNKEVLQHIEVPMTYNGNLSRKEWSINLCFLLTEWKILAIKLYCF
jgi:hypothetical protein